MSIERAERAALRDREAAGSIGGTVCSGAALPAGSTRAAVGRRAENARARAAVPSADRRPPVLRGAHSLHAGPVIHLYSYVFFKGERLN